jgi:hypothetical protein
MRLGLIALMFLTGCLEELFCVGDVHKAVHWSDQEIYSSMLSGSGDARLLTWDGRDGVHVAAIEGDNVHRLDLGYENNLAVEQTLSAPAGHVLMNRHPMGQPYALSFGREGDPKLSPIDVPNTARAVYDGTNFLLVWCEYDPRKERSELMLGSLVPGADAISQPVVSGACPLLVPSMASAGGVTWLVWLQDSSVVGIRIVNGARIDTTPVVLLQDRRMIHPANSLAKIVASNGRFLVAVNGSGDRGPSLLVAPLDGNAVRGAVVELPGYNHDELIGDATGFATLRRDSPNFTSSFGSNTQLTIGRLALDGKLVREQELVGAAVSLGFDGSRLLAALREDFPDGDEGETVLSIVELDGASSVEIVRNQLELTESTSCE